MKDLTGRRVEMKQSNAKWYLEHPDIYVSGIDWDASYETETYIHMACCLGVPIYGRIVRKGTDCWLVKFRLGGKTCRYYIDRNQFFLLD